MSTVKVSETHTLSDEEARRRVARFEETQLKRFGIKLDWKGSRARIQGMGVTGDAELAPGRVDITLKLGMLAKAAGVDPEKLQSSMAKRLAAALEEDAAV